MSLSRLINRNVTSGAGRTSMRLEPEIWDALTEICARERLRLGELVRKVDARPEGDGGRTSAMRCFAIGYFRTAATEAGHLAAGHGKLDYASAATGPV